MRKPSSRLNGLASIIALPLFAHRLLKQINAKPSQADTAHPTNDAQQDKPTSPPMVSVGPNRNIKEATNRAGDGQNKTKKARKRRWTYKRWQNVLTGMIAAFTAISTIGLIYSLREIRISRETENRAYVGVSNVEEDFEAGQIKVTLENIGRIPAEIIEVNLVVSRYAENGERLEFYRASYGNYFARIFPGTFKPQIVYQLRNFTKENVALIRAGKEELHLMCYLDYKDGFGNFESWTLGFKYNPPPNEGWSIMQLQPYQSADLKEWLEEAKKKYETNPDQK